MVWGTRSPTESLLGSRCCSNDRVDSDWNLSLVVDEEEEESVGEQMSNKIIKITNKDKDDDSVGRILAK